MEEISHRNLDEKTTILICSLYSISHRAIDEFMKMQKLTDFERIFVIQKSADSVFDLISALEQIRPKYFIIFDPSLDIIRTDYQYKTSQRGIPLRTYVLTFYGGIDANLIAFQEKIEYENFGKENMPETVLKENQVEKKMKLIFFDLETTSIKDWLYV